MPSPVKFPLYHQRWIASTRHLTLEARAAYLELLIWQFDHNNQPIPDDKKFRENLLGLSPFKTEKIWKEISGYWVSEDGGLINESLRRKSSEDSKFVEAQREKGRKSGVARRAKKDLVELEPRLNRNMNPGSTPVRTPVEPPYSLKSNTYLAGYVDPAIPNAVPSARFDRARETEESCQTQKCFAADHVWHAPPNRPGYCVSTDLHAELLGRDSELLADPTGSARLLAWYSKAFADHLASGAPIMEGVRLFWLRRFEAVLAEKYPEHAALSAEQQRFQRRLTVVS